LLMDTTEFSVREATTEEQCYCYDGWVYLGYMAPEELGGDEVEITYCVPCRRCASEAGRGGAIG
jgi:hypothetical protein